jgi:hypothetical protein
MTLGFRMTAINDGRCATGAPKPGPMRQVGIVAAVENDGWAKSDRGISRQHQ